jgi:metallophosphoesterase (TIGR03768 family)
MRRISAGESPGVRPATAAWLDATEILPGGRVLKLGCNPKLNIVPAPFRSTNETDTTKTSRCVTHKLLRGYMAASRTFHRNNKFASVLKETTDISITSLYERSNSGQNMAIDDPSEKSDSIFSNSISRREFIELSVGAVAFVSFSSLLSGCGGSTLTEPSYPISSEVYTTRHRAIAPDAVTPPSPPISPWDASQFKENGYGLWHYVDGIDSGKDAKLMPSTYDPSSVTHAASLLRFFTLTDTHIYDKESPSQPFYLLMRDVAATIPGIPGITYTMLYTTQILDAAIQTVNVLHQQKPFDCGLFLGDACNNSQYNELRWYLDVIDGKYITPSSGAHVGADTIDYQKPFQAAGLDKTISWYQVKGSHDNFWFGSSVVTDSLEQTYVGDTLLCAGDVLANPLTGFGQHLYYMGTVDGTTQYGNFIGAGPVGTTKQIQVAADPNRRSLNMQDWMSEFFHTSSNPVGHGFTQENIENKFASYSFDPKSNLPITVIMLDDTQSEKEPGLKNYGNGALNQARYNWLVKQLEKGQSEGKLMIVATHVPIGVSTYDSDATGSWGPASCVQDDQLVATLQHYPNFILWLAGHQHNNQVKAFPSTDSSQPELGFWEVQTGSLRDFPQHFRTFDIFRNSDNTISTIITNVDAAVADGSPAAMSRFYAVAAKQLYATDTLPDDTPTCVCNAELIQPLSPEMQIKIRNYGAPIQK